MEKIQLNDSRFPPYGCLFQAVKNAPKSALLYLQLWLRRDDHNKLDLWQPSVREEFLMTKHMFHNRLIELAREGLVSFESTPTRYKIEMMVIDDEEFDAA